MPSGDAVRREVRRFRGFAAPKNRTVQIAFFGGNFLGLPHREIQDLLKAADDAVQAGEADGIRFSTRPDTICAESVKMISPYAVETVEIGVQSMRDRVLAASLRGHTSAQAAEAAQRVTSEGYQLGIQMMIGLPGDDDAGALASGRRIAALGPSFVRIYPTLVLAGSRLAQWYRQGRYRPLTLAAAVPLSRRLYQLFQESGVAVARMGLHPSPELEHPEVMLAGPYHPAFGDLVHSEIFLEKAAALAAGRAGLSSACFRAHPRSISRLRGHGGRNIALLRKRCGLRQVQMLADTSVAPGTVVLDAAAGS